MLEYVIAIFSLVFVIAISIIGYFYIQYVRKDNWDSIQKLVSEINEKKKYEYEYDQNQVNNLKSTGHTVNSMTNSLEDMKHNIDALKSTTIKYGDSFMSSGILPDENGYVKISAAGEPKILIDAKNDSIFLRGNVYICNPLGQNCQKL